MTQREFTVHNQSGLHVRPASVLVNGLGKFDSDITILFGGQDYNAKSVINILAAGIKQGDRFVARADGPDETEALAEVEALISSGLGE